MTQINARQVTINVCAYCCTYHANARKIGRLWAVVCAHCHARGPRAKTRAEAIRLWNERPAVRGVFKFPEIPR